MIRLPPGLLIAAMVIVIIAVDYAFFRHRFWERLMANIAIVIIFGAIYMIFLRRS
ncbi:hypothetical protein [uncultured Sphingomonas sp.]|uniref:hypothetical protein n=1 Tax=uncultured Sphingomonas sp. TaxID=158754 RepID=UPI0026087CE6|nr:hypothetical protein [uncultured Sphingomonas sp.]